MNLIKMIRKNKSKIMGVVLIVIMIGFVGGYAMQRWLESRGANKQVAATFGDDLKIRGTDLVSARAQLDILKQLGINTYFVKLGIYAKDTPLLLINELLFGDNTSSARLNSYFKVMAKQGQLPLDPAVTEAFFESNEGRSGVYWILLNYEASQAGCAVTREQAIETYKTAIAPALFGQDADASKVVAAISKRAEISQEMVMDIVARVFSIQVYVSTVCLNENVTLPEIESVIGFEKEKFSAEFVKFAASDFVDQIGEINEDSLSAQFEEYKDKVAGELSQDNPYGFGYVIPARVQLEYLVIKPGDLDQAIPAPTPEEMEKYYQMHKSSFTEEIPSDPTNPESEKITRNKTYAEVATSIKQKLINEKRDSKAESIITEAADIIAKDLMDKDTEKFTGTDYKKFAGDYAQTAKELSDKYNINVYSGKTGYLSAEALQKDMNLSMLSIQKGQTAPVSLMQLAFAVPEISVTKLSKFEGKAPQLYQNIGPLKAQYGNTLAIVRVIDAKKAQAPQSIDETYDVTPSSLKAGEIKTQTKSVKDDVINDCKLLEAMKIAQEKAQDFIKTAGDDWNKSLEAYNKEFKKNLKVSKLEDQSRTAEYALKTLNVQFKSMPSPGGYYQYMMNNKFLKDQLFEAAGKEMPQTFELKSDMSYYALKSVDVKHPTTKDLEDVKLTVAFTKNIISSWEAALIHLNADNLIERNGYKETKEEKSKEEDQK